MAEKNRTFGLMLPEEKIARRFSQRHKLEPPVNTESLVRKFAVLEEDNLPEGYDAVFLDQSAKLPKPRVIISNKLPATRRVFTFGHELGHILIPWHNGTHFCSVGAEARLVDALVREIESQANRFAAELLMPAAWVENIVNRATSIRQWVEAVKTANVSYLAASIRLVQILPEGYAFVEIDSDDVVQRVTSTAGTKVFLPELGQILAQGKMDRLAADFAAFSSGSSKIIWWRFATKLEAPKMESIHSNATEILRQIAEEIFLDKEEAAQQIMSVNGIIGAANGGFKMKQQGDLFTILKQRFAHRTKLEGIVAHPLFDSFLQKRTEEITARENGSPF